MDDENSDKYECSKVGILVNKINTSFTEKKDRQAKKLRHLCINGRVFKFISILNIIHDCLSDIYSFVMLLFSSHSFANAANILYFSFV